MHSADRATPMAKGYGRKEMAERNWSPTLGAGGDEGIESDDIGAAVVL